MTPIMGFGYDIFNSYDITTISAMASLAIDCLLDSRSGGIYIFRKLGPSMKKEKRNNLRFDSKAAYIPPDEATKAVTPPIVMASSFQYDRDIFQRILDGERKDVNIYG